MLAETRDRSLLYSVQPDCRRHLVCSVRSRVCLQNYHLLRYYAASSGNFLVKFRDIMTVPSAGFNLKMRPIGCSETSVRNYHYSLRNNPEERSPSSRVINVIYCIKLPCTVGDLFKQKTWPMNLDLTEQLWTNYVVV